MYDGLGSVLGEVAPDGPVSRTQAYDVYGAVRTSAGTATSKHKYVGSLGHPSEDDTGLVYMRARWMDPATGRFVSEDPAQWNANWHLYARSAPTYWRDYTGREEMAEVLTVEYNGQTLQSSWGSAVWYAGNQAVKKALIESAAKFGVQLTEFGASAAVHAIKTYMTMGGANNIGIDKYGFLWTKNGQCIGWILDFI